jgi:hypothetical protein
LSQILETQTWILEKMSGEVFQIRIKSQATGEYLYAAADDLAHDPLRRRVFTWTNTSATPISHSEFWDKTADWEIHHREQFFMLKNVKFSEYLYAASDSLSFDEDNRSVFTWRNYYSLGQEGFWRFNKDVLSKLTFSKIWFKSSIRDNL